MGTPAIAAQTEYEGSTPGQKGSDGRYPWEREEQRNVSANEFNWKGHLRAQGRAVMESLERARQEHPVLQANDGKMPTWTMYRMVEGKKETVELNKPWVQIFDGKRTVHGLDDIKRWEKQGWKQVTPWADELDPKDKRIAELEALVTNSSKRDGEINELRAQNEKLQAQMTELLGKLNKK